MRPRPLLVRAAVSFLVVVGGACAGGASAAAKGKAAPCRGAPASRGVKLTAADGLVVHGTFATPCQGERRPVVVLVHQMCRTRAEWREATHDWIDALHARGVATLAIDLRGHGESTAWPGGGRHDLCDERTQDDAGPRFAGMVDDVAAAIAWAKADGAPAVAVVGASIGANSALVAAGRDPDVRLAIALSPGLDYMGIAPADAVAALGARAVLIAARDDDGSAQAVAALGGHGADARVLDDGGHGNAMIAAHPALLGELVDRLVGSLR